MAITYSSVECYEHHTSLTPNQETIGRQDWTAQVTLQTPWAKRYDLVFDILSNQRKWPGGSHSLKPRAANALIQPLASSATTDGQGMVYQDALVTVYYMVPNDAEGTNLIAEEIEPATEFIVVDHKRLRWGAANGDPILEREAPGRISRSVRFKRTYYQRPTVHLDYLSLPGTCNQASVTSLLTGLTFAAETMMYEDPAISRTIKTDGSGLAFTLMTSFIFRPGGWNKYWRQKTNTFEEQFDYQGGRYTNYPPASWTNIWI